ncbi:hypothetical protein PUN28_008941 [Cardiocondyla obscurior]|uniref:Uncharacterized protein n=1 Tax=Cardiocondyla obscurior TaxID=286306 RepID=A0AAW2FR47_9HYME
MAVYQSDYHRIRRGRSVSAGHPVSSWSITPLRHLPFLVSRGANLLRANASLRELINNLFPVPSIFGPNSKF